MSTKLKKQLSGVAGEYYVAAEFTRNGLLAAITLRNSNGVDILVTDENGQHQLAIQVKTTQGKKKWLLTAKIEHEINSAESKYFVFVSLPMDRSKAPEYSIIKAIDLGAFIKTSHQNWLSNPEKNRKDIGVRQYEEKYALEAGYKTFNEFTSFVEFIREKIM
ncbi:hypothetical protein [Chryseobacterium indologenes]|uniref:hypothetical protein n=1 Tax=Chryseobacterium indologenes TaxID=253 RepID=UPI001024603C|nr:hypothetical protein [Chryseobacterium indologenes]VFA41509.1 Uncharacterised protein [Chryseobacterium indologenes]